MEIHICGEIYLKPDSAPALFWFPTTIKTHNHGAVATLQTLRYRVEHLSIQ